jgi:hypothetical protein
MQETNKIWARGKPLSKYFWRLLSVTTLRGLAPIVISARDRRSKPILASFAEAAARTAEQAQILRRREYAIEHLRRELVHGDVQLVGRRHFPGSAAIVETVPSDFWIGAAIDPENDRATNSGVTYDLLREPRTSRPVKEATTSAAVKQPVPMLPTGLGTVPPRTTLSRSEFAGLGRKDKRALAIDACASPDQLQWWNTGKDARRKGYADWIVKTYEFKVTGAYGFGADSWEASEIEYKRNRNLLTGKSPKSVRNQTRGASNSRK